MRYTFIVITLGFLPAYFPCSAQDILTHIQDILPKEIKVAGFHLERSQDVEIEAVGFRPSRRHGFYLTNAWILDARSRQLVWELPEADVDQMNRRLARFEDEIELGKGDYEVYYSTFPDTHLEQDDGFRRFFDRIFGDIFDKDDDFDYSAHRRDWGELKIVLRGNGKRLRESDIEQYHRSFARNSIVSMTSLRDNEYLQKGFRVERPLNVEIYAIGEIRRDGTFDYGWLVNTETRAKVWKFSYRNSNHAGGGRKNRMVNGIISLKPGQYVAFFVTDDSHSYSRWNDAPPYDPAFWGLTIKPVNTSDMKFVKDYDYQRFDDKNVIVRFNRLQDNEFRSQGFTCKRDLDVHIYALGEGRRKEMFDYGWIVDSRTRRKIWEMTYSNTEHAGGGDKNRLYDDVIKLRAGSYIVYYVTDGSHSTWEWNTTPPHDQENWGITISAVNDNFREGDVTDYDERRDNKILAQIIRVRDYAHERERFRLARDSEVRVYALGEGMNGRMYDYGWIENADTRKVIWEMTYRRTEHAGGASKNRLFDGAILLKKGEYIVYYESDDSHSFNHWNASRPYDPLNWGITVSLVEER